MIQFLFRPRVARTVACISAVATVCYLLWRCSSTLNSEALLFSILLVGAEAMGFLQCLLFAFMTWDVHHRAAFRRRSGLAVDVFVPTYNEEVDILEATLIGCQAIRYPHTTYVLDDGRRPAVQALAQRLDCQYLTREDNRHAKAGNLNAALSRTSGQFIAVLDADTVPQPDFLDKTLGYFTDKNVALVQLPQEFYNVDSLQHAGDGKAVAPWHEQALFYRVIQPGKNLWNAAFWCGSPSVVRRAAILDVGGVATESVTEDIHTSIRLHARGWRTIYHNETLAFGIAPQTMNAFVTQRSRWAQGTMQLLRSRENPVIIPGLSLAQRLNYFASMFTYFEAYQKLVYLLTPAVILVTGILPISCDMPSFLTVWCVYSAFGGLANVALGRGHYRYLDVERFNVLKMFTFIGASTVLLWPRRLLFKVTPKSSEQSTTSREWRPTLWHLLTVGFGLVAIVLGIINLLWQTTGRYAKTDIIVVTAFWAVINCGLIAWAAAGVIARLRRRLSYRFSAEVMAEVTGPDGQRSFASTSDVSASGIGLILRYESQPDAADTDTDFEHGQHIMVKLHLPEGPVVVDGEVVNMGRLPGGQQRLGISFGPMAWSDRQVLTRFLFVTLPRAIDSGIRTFDMPVAEPAVLPRAQLRRAS
ncbi:MAG: glycosyltransferase family 2 protein [Chloroflexota bacterium]